MKIQNHEIGSEQRVAGRVWSKKESTIEEYEGKQMEGDWGESQ